MSKICTSIEQSKKLIELGLDVYTADMKWFISLDEYSIEEISVFKQLVEFNLFAYDDIDWDNTHFIPAWTISALLNIIPNWTMNKTDKINLTCNLYYHCEVGYNDPIDAAFETICWLLENNKI